MSKTSEHKYTCKNCGEEYTIVIYDSVNVTIEPDLKEKVLTGKIFEYKCPKCGFEQRITYPLLYHDMDKHYMIYLGYDKNSIEEFQYMANVNELAGIFTATKPINYIVRGVTNYLELYSKVNMLDNNLDDRIVEMMKYEIIKHYTDEMKRDKKKVKKIIDCVFIQHKEDNGFSWILYPKSGEPIAYDLPMVIYKERLADYWDLLQHSKASYIDEEFFSKLDNSRKCGSANCYEQDMKPVYCAYDTDGNFHLCMEKKENKTPYIKVVFGNTSTEEEKEDIIPDGSIVFIEGDNSRIKCKIVKHTIESWYTLPKWDSHYDWIVSRSKPINFETTADSDDDLQDNDLKILLQKYTQTKANGNWENLFKKLNESSVITLYEAKMSTNDLEQLLNLSKGDIIETKDDIGLTSCKEIIEDKVYLAVYTNQKEIDKVRLQCSMKFVFSFKKILEIVQQMEKINGIVINPNTDAVILTYTDIRFFDTIRNWAK